MKLSVVVPVYNGGTDLRACLEALTRSSRPADEIIVVDDASTDGAARCAAEFGARVMAADDRADGGPRGAAQARNRGAGKASGELLVFVDADVEVHRDTLARFERLFEHEPQLAAAFGSYDDQPTAPGRVSRFKNLLHHYVHQQAAGAAETFWSGCGAIRRTVFRAVGGFAPRRTIEDIELGARLVAGGHRVRLCPEILCTHRKRWTLALLLRTDILGRAVPWTRLILQQGRLPSGLNTNWSSRLSALLAGGLAFAAVLGGGAALASSWRVGLVAGALAAASAVGLGILNRRLYRFFFGHGDVRFGLTALGLHLLYLLYSSAVFAALLAFDRLTGGSAATPQAPRPPPSRAKRHVAGGLLFAALFALYVGNGEPLPGGDATSNVHLAANLIQHGRLAYTPQTTPFLFIWRVAHQGQLRETKFRSWDEPMFGRTMRELYAAGALRSPKPMYYLSPTRKPDAYVSSYGFATGLFALPFVAAARPFVNDLAERASLLWFLCKLAAAFAVAASAWLLFQVAADHLRLGSAIGLTLAYGLGTCVWSVSSQALWQHAPGELFLALGMFCLFRRSRGGAPTFAGLAFGIAFLCRPTNSAAVLAGFLVLLGDRRSLLRYVLGGLPAAVAFAVYNLYYFGTLVTFGQVTALAARVSSGNTSVLWQHSFVDGLAGVLLSPGRGLFFYSPVLLVAVWGAVHVWRERRWLPLRAAAIAAAGICLVTARWSGWWGGWSWGYRLVVDTAVLLAFLAIPVVEQLRRRRILGVVVAVLLLWSVGVQALGAYVYDVGGWNNRDGFIPRYTDNRRDPALFTDHATAMRYCQPRGCGVVPVRMNVDHPQYNRRLWSLRDNPILFYLQNLDKARRQRAAAWRSFIARDG